jgi:hypothetical protein
MKYQRFLFYVIAEIICTAWEAQNHIQTFRLSLQFSKVKSLFLTNPGTTRIQILKVLVLKNYSHLELISFLY